MHFSVAAGIVIRNENEISQHSSQLEIRCPKQPYGWPATQSLQDGTTPVASSIHNPATSPHSSRRESPSATRSKGARGEKATAPLPKRKREAPDRPIHNNIPPTAVEGAVEGTVAAEICGNGPWGASCEDEHGAGKASADKLMLVLRVLFIIKHEREPHTNERRAEPMNDEAKFENLMKRRQTGLRKEELNPP